MLLAGFLGQEEAGAFDYQVGTNVAPGEVGGVTFCGQANLVAVDHQVVALYGDVAIEVAVD